MAKFPSWEPEYARKKAKEYYLKHGERIRTRVSKYKETNKVFLAGYKLARGCIDCGYKKHPAALHFDHVKGNKKKPLALMKNYSRVKILEEIEKCEVRCANCHAIMTQQRKYKEDSD